MSERNKGKISLDEEELIRLIAVRPILYDRSLKTYRKLSLRHQYWKQVGEIMGCSVEGCRRRWRSLRDSFAKKHKNANRMQIKWKFYKQMAFIAPYLDNSSAEIDDQLLDDFADNSNDADVSNLQLPDKPEEEQQSMHLESIHLPIDIETNELKLNSTAINTNESHTPKTMEETAVVTQPHDADSDEKFLLSCAPVLRRLPARKSAFARLKIQQLLYEIEFDEQFNDC